MKAFALDGFGEQGSVRDLPVPDPAEGQVRLRIAVAGVNPFDAAVVQGYLKDHMEHRFPLVPGMDASGTVEAMGEGVEGYAVGDEVFGSVGKSYLGEGTWAEFTTASAGTVTRRPSSLDHARGRRDADGGCHGAEHGRCPRVVRRADRGRRGCDGWRGQFLRAAGRASGRTGGGGL